MQAFSANLGFLWKELPLRDAIYAAHQAGFAAVECHAPYDVPPAVLRTALDETGLPLLSLNTRLGRSEHGDFGLAALPGREVEAREAIDEALAYAHAAGAAAVHVIAGRAKGKAARDAFVQNLTYACEIAKGRTILIEPLNRHDVPGYFLETSVLAAELIDEINAPNLKLMFDCYHVARTETDLVVRLIELLPRIGHIQFASVPDRGPPDQGDIDYAKVFETLSKMGWTRPIGAEYRVTGSTEATLGWMQKLSDS